MKVKLFPLPRALQVIKITSSGGWADNFGSKVSYFDLPLLKGATQNMASVKKTVEAARFTQGTMTVHERLTAAAAERRAEALGKRQQMAAQSFLAVCACGLHRAVLSLLVPSIGLR